MSAGLRLILYDRTCVNRGGFGLSRAWHTGSHLYAAWRRSDAAYGCSNWAEGLAWLAGVQPERRIAEVQYWGHGKWGELFVARESLNEQSLAPGHPLHLKLRDIRERLAPEAQFWFRTCETFGAERGHRFAQQWTDFFGCAAAGHTYIIGYWQSGLHRLQPGLPPRWSVHEGLRDGTPLEPRRAYRSGPLRANTITCLHGTIPPHW